MMNAPEAVLKRLSVANPPDEVLRFRSRPYLAISAYTNGCILHDEAYVLEGSPWNVQRLLSNLSFRQKLTSEPTSRPFQNSHQRPSRSRYDRQFDRAHPRARHSADDPPRGHGLPQDLRSLRQLQRHRRCPGSTDCSTQPRPFRGQNTLHSWHSRDIPRYCEAW